MLSRSRITLSFAVILGAAAAALSTHAFAENGRLGWDGHATSSQAGKGARAQMNLYLGGNAIRAERLRPQALPQRWIDNPASPGG
jgi:hypothetical protein